MKNTVKCKNCGVEIEVSEAITHQIEEQVLASLEIKHKKEIDEVKNLAMEEAKKKSASEFELELKKAAEEAAENKEANKKMQEQILELTKELRATRKEKDEVKLAAEKKLLEDEEKIRFEVKKLAEEEHRLKDMEKDKKLADTLKQMEELKTKMQQGSEQTQGEVLELELERILRTEFPSDEIREIKKGERGADVVQTVVDRLGRKCGIILWETKNAQWQNPWIEKLKEDQREKKADLAVLVTINKPEWLQLFSYKEGVWVATFESIVSLAFALRFSIVSLHHAKVSNEGKNEKMETLYHYLTGIEFKNRVEAIVEAFSSMQDELEREKRWFSAKWNRQEKEIRKVLDHTHGMYGDLQGIVGRSLSGIKTLELPEGQDLE